MRIHINNMIDIKYISKKVKSKGFKMSEVAEKIGVQYQTVNKNLKNNSYETVQRIAENINVSFFELLIPPAGYDHFYDSVTGEWLGIRKK